METGRGCNYSREQPMPKRKGRCLPAFTSGNRMNVQSFLMIRRAFLIHDASLIVFRQPPAAHQPAGAHDSGKIISSGRGPAPPPPMIDEGVIFGLRFQRHHIDLRRLHQRIAPDSPPLHGFRSNCGHCSRECEQGSGQHIFNSRCLESHREKSTIALTFQHPGGNRFFPLFFTLEPMAASALLGGGKPAPLLREIV